MDKLSYRNLFLKKTVRNKAPYWTECYYVQHDGCLVILFLSVNQRGKVCLIEQFCGYGLQVCRG